MQPIETSYAGCRFRSRLEARWAVAFDVLGIRWEYEPQGFELGHRLSNTPGTYRYLPDFWLPDHQLWAEVKGSLADESMLKLLDCAADLSSNGGGGRHDRGGDDIVVLGPIAAPAVVDTYYPCMRVPVGLCMNKGMLIAGPWVGDSGCRCGAASEHPFSQCLVAGADYGGGLSDVCSDMGVDAVRSLLLHGVLYPVTSMWERAMDAARRARFEHGERPLQPA